MKNINPLFFIPKNLGLKAGIAFFILAFICSCNKTEEEIPIITKVHGHLKVLGTDEIINDRPYRIQFINTSSEVLDEAFTDENGFYQFEKRALRYEHSRFALKFDRRDLPDNTFTGGVALILDTIEEPIPNRSPQGSNKGHVSFYPGFRSWVNVCLEKKAWLKLEVENVGGSFGDYIRIHFVSYRGSDVNWSSWEFVFNNPHFEILLPGVGNVENHIDYWVKKNGEFIPLQRASVKLGEMDTTYFKLEY
ncbi:MAG: hypothetical protein JJU02_02020 [Cryomorphaceae bacterium]|nr:hypothetical protein [Cryomorphaceae bacterium]